MAGIAAVLSNGTVAADVWRVPGGIPGGRVNARPPTGQKVRLPVHGPHGIVACQAEL